MSYPSPGWITVGAIVYPIGLVVGTELCLANYWILGLMVHGITVGFVVWAFSQRSNFGGIWR